MSWVLRLVGFAMCGMAAACSAQAPSHAPVASAAAKAPAPWPDTPSTRIFRQRTLDLAVLYGESSGLDPNGYLIETTDQGPARPGCRSVLVRTSLGGVAVSAEALEVCKNIGKDKAP
jgi:hypothetical protein